MDGSCSRQVSHFIYDTIQKSEPRRLTKVTTALCLIKYIEHHASVWSMNNEDFLSEIISYANYLKGVEGVRKECFKPFWIGLFSFLQKLSENFPEFNRSISKLIMLPFKNLILNASKQLWMPEVKSPFRSAKSPYYHYIEAGVLFLKTV